MRIAVHLRMPTTRRKVVKTVYKDDDDSDGDGDFSDSGSDAVLSQPSTSEEEYSDNSENEFQNKPQKKQNEKASKMRVKKTNFTKSFINKLNKQNVTNNDLLEEIPFSIKDMTEADKLLPSVLNLSESDSSDDESSKIYQKKNDHTLPLASSNDPDSEAEVNTEYRDVWSQNNQDESEEIARKTYLELQKHKNKIEETKISIQNYVMQKDKSKESDIKDLLALGEEESSEVTSCHRNIKNDDSDAEMEDWEEVKESKGIPQQGLQLIVGIPDAVCRKSKKVDVEMMMKRKMNRVKKEYQVYMHKVHVLCWIGHGNYVSQVLNDQELMSAVLSLVPSKECYPGERVDIKYIEQIVTWYKNKIKLRQDKHENKFKPKALPLKTLLLEQIKKREFTTKKCIVLAFVSMLRSLGLQCRVMLNFLTLPIKPSSSELCSLSTKSKDDKENPKANIKKEGKKVKKVPEVKHKIPQVDGNYDTCYSDSDFENIIQLDGNDDNIKTKTRRGKNIDIKAAKQNGNLNEDVSPPKKPRRQTRSQIQKGEIPDLNSRIDIKKPVNKDQVNKKVPKKPLSINKHKTETENKKAESIIEKKLLSKKHELSTRENEKSSTLLKSTSTCAVRKRSVKPKIIVTNENNDISSKYFANSENEAAVSRKRSRTSESKPVMPKTETNRRTRSVQSNAKNTSKYFGNSEENIEIKKSPVKTIKAEDNKRVSHRDLSKSKQNPKTDVTEDLKHIIKERVKEAKQVAKSKITKKHKEISKESDDDSDYLPVESPKRKKSGSEDDFKIKKNTPKVKAGSSKKIDRRLLSTDDELPANKVDIWAEVFVEELEEWISVDVIKGKVHCAPDIYKNATHPVTYVVGWDNNNNVKDLTRRYVPHWNTVTRKQRVDNLWWDTAIKPWLGPKTARDREEDERLDRMQLEAPLPTSIAEYKNHPLYALRRHLLKFEALYPPDAATLGFVRGEPVYARSCVYVCRSRDTWLKEAKVVRLGEQPYKVVKARPKWDRLSNKLITDKPLEVFGPWQVQDYEPPTAENGIVPRNAYGNVELFKDCMLPKGTVHLKLPGLNRVAKKWNIDCAPAMTGFDFNGGWSHPVFDGFVVCKEFEEIITEAWLKDQEDQERKEAEKLEARVYGNWKRLIKGLLIKERLKAKYGFEEPSTSKETAKSKAPKLIVKKI